MNPAARSPARMIMLFWTGAGSPRLSRMYM